MKQFLMVIALILASKVGLAVPLQLHNRIVFTRGALQPSGDETVWTMDADGGDQKRVWRVPKGYGRFGGFSHDGKLALSFNNFNLYLHDLQTKRFQRVLGWNDGFGTYIGPVSFSPDGKQILCEVGDSAQNWSYTRIMRFPVGKSYSSVEEIESITLRLTGQDVPAKNLWSEPRWSVDGKHILAVGGLSFSPMSPPLPEAQPDIWLMNTDGTQAHRVTTDAGWDLNPVLSPNGQNIAFVRRLDTGQGGDLGYDSYNLCTIDVTNKTETFLTHNPKTFAEMQDSNTVIETPIFSLDGNQIIFNQLLVPLRGQVVSWRKGIYRIDADGTNQKRLGDGHLVQWSY